MNDGAIKQPVRAASRPGRNAARRSRGRDAAAPAGSSPSRPRRSTASAPTRPTPRPWRSIYAAKERPRFNPLIAHVATSTAADAQGVVRRAGPALAQRFWPGPLTLVVPGSRPGCTVSDLARAGLDSVGLRVPAHPLAQALLRAVGRPVAAPSANRSGRVSPTQAEHVLADLDGRIDAVLDGGATQVGRRIDHRRLPRRRAAPAAPGRRAARGDRGGARRKLAREPERETRPLAPGMLASHYAPRARVRLDATRIEPGEAVLLFGVARPAGLDAAPAGR